MGAMPHNYSILNGDLHSKPLVDDPSIFNLIFNKRLKYKIRD